MLLPRGAGELQQDPWQRSLQCKGTNPSGWTNMQLLAAYAADSKAGLDVAMHDPLGSTQDILVESRPAERAVTLAFDHPAANMGVGGNGFELNGEAVWQLLHGDWFDAAVLYRDWVRRCRPLVPAAGARGPGRHALWMRGAFGLGPDRRAPTECVARVKEFQKYLGGAGGFPLVHVAPDPFRQRLGGRRSPGFWRAGRSKGWVLQGDADRDHDDRVCTGRAQAGGVSAAVEETVEFLARKYGPEAVQEGSTAWPNAWRSLSPGMVTQPSPSPAGSAQPA